MKSKPKVVFDTNIYLSAIIFGGNPRTCLELARKYEIKLFASRTILLELSQKLSNKFKWADRDIVDLVEGLLKFVELVEPKEKISQIKADPTDNKILECACAAKADYIVSGDIKHILTLKNFRGIKILNARDFLGVIYQRHR